MSTISYNKRPQPGDYADFYANYVNQVEGVDIMSTLEKAKDESLSFMESIPEPAWKIRYAPGKWSVAELILHVIDAERVFAYRALRIGRGDQTPLAGFDQDLYVPNSNAAHRSPYSIAEEYRFVREASIHLFKHFDAEMWERRAEASGDEVTALALAYIIAGHESHHNRIIRERYL